MLWQASKIFLARNIILYVGEGLRDIFCHVSYTFALDVNTNADQNKNMGLCCPKCSQMPLDVNDKTSWILEANCDVALRWIYGAFGYVSSHCIEQ